MPIDWTHLPNIPPTLRERAEAEYAGLIAAFPDYAPRDGFDLVAILEEIALLGDETDPTGERRRALMEMAKAAILVRDGFVLGVAPGPIH